MSDKWIVSKYHYDGLPVITGTGGLPYETWTVCIKRFDNVTGQQYWGVFLQSTMYESALNHYRGLVEDYGYGNIALMNLGPDHLVHEEKEAI